VKLFLFRTKLQDCFPFVKKNFEKLFLRNWLQMSFPPWILSACLYGIVLSFRAGMHILIEGKIALISFGGTCCLPPLAKSLGVFVGKSHWAPYPGSTKTAQI
jgi:hypothetical protein